MPAPNDLTPEEEREFAQFGVQSRGPGGEPVIEEGQQQQQDPNQEVTEGGQPVQQPQAHGDRDVDPNQAVQQFQEQQGQSQVDREALRATIDPRRENGQFKSKEEIDQELDQLVAQQGPQGQQQGQQPPPQGFVPHQAFHAERERAKQLGQQLALATARMNAMLTQQQGQQNQLPDLPDPAQDPLAYVRGLEERINMLQQEREQDQQYRQIDEALEQDEVMFSQTMPDYEQASDYYVQSRSRELLQFHTPQDAHRIMVQEARQIATQAWQRGMPAAQAIYSLAEARGYNRNAPVREPVPQPVVQQGQQPQPQQQGNGQAQIQRLQNNQQNGPRSLGGGGGSARVNNLNANALLDMSDEEFEQYLQLGSKGANARFASIG